MPRWLLGSWLVTEYYIQTYHNEDLHLESSDSYFMQIIIGMHLKLHRWLNLFRSKNYS